MLFAQRAQQHGSGRCTSSPPQAVDCCLTRLPVHVVQVLDDVGRGWLELFFRSGFALFVRQWSFTFEAFGHVLDDNEGPHDLFG